MIYVMTCQPYQSLLLNVFVFTSEAVYVLCCISTLVFSDSEPNLAIKFTFSIVLSVTVVLLIFNNFIMVITLLYRGPDQLKIDCKLGKQKRIEAEIQFEVDRQVAKQEIA